MGKHEDTGLLNYDHSGNINSKYSVKCGFNHVDYDRLIRIQNYRCACCGSDRALANGSLRFRVDHCHKTNKIRGLLCHQCNQALGAVDDSVEYLQKLVEYLRRSHQDSAGELPSRKRLPVVVKVAKPQRSDKYSLQYVHPLTLRRVSKSTGTDVLSVATGMAKRLESSLNSDYASIGDAQFLDAIGVTK